MERMLMESLDNDQIVAQILANRIENAMSAQKNFAEDLVANTITKKILFR